MNFIWEFILLYTENSTVSCIKSTTQLINSSSHLLSILSLISLCTSLLHIFDAVFLSQTDMIITLFFLSAALVFKVYLSKSIYAADILHLLHLRNSFLTIVFTLLRKFIFTAILQWCSVNIVCLRIVLISSWIHIRNVLSALVMIISVWVHYKRFLIVFVINWSYSYNRLRLNSFVFSSSKLMLLLKLISCAKHCVKLRIVLKKKSLIFFKNC